MPLRLRNLMVCVLGLALACKSDEVVPATQVIVSVNSDLEVGTQLTSIEVSVYDFTGEELAARQPFELTAGKPREGEFKLPFSFGIEKARADRFRLHVIGFGPLGEDGAKQQVVEQKLVSRFRNRQTLLLKVFLGEICARRKQCAEELTCYPEASARIPAGECGAPLEPTLEPVDPGDEKDAWMLPPSAGSSGGDAGPDAAAGDAGDAGDVGAGGTSGEPRAGSGGTAPDAGAGDAGGAIDADTGGAGASGGGGAGGAGAGGAGAGGAGAGGAGGCRGVERSHPIQDGSVHVPSTMPSDYNSAPPSSGLHCDEIGAYGTFTPQAPLLACNFVHNLDLGAIVLLYNCPEPCPEIVAGLEEVRRAAPPDPDCVSADGLKRILLTPYAGMDATFAASAWGYTWTSECTTFTAADGAALLDFIDRHWGTRGVSSEPNNCSYGTIFPAP